MWKTVKLGTICKLVNGKAFKPSDWSEDGIKIVRIQNLNDTAKTFNHWAGPLNKQVQIDKGDLLLAWSGTPGTSFGAHIWNNGKAILNQHIFRIDLHDGVIDPEWARMSINHKLNILIDQAHGGVGLQHVTKPMVENLQILLPPLPIQKQIAAILKKADAAREKRRHANQLTEQFLQSAFLEMFGDPVTNPKGWELRSLGELAAPEKFSIVDGPFGSHLKASEYTESGVRVIRVNNIYPNEFNFGDVRYVMAEKYESIKRSTVRPNDVLMAKVGNTIGKTCVFPRTIVYAVMTANVCKITLDKQKAHPVFVSRQMNFEGIQLQIRKLSGDTAKPMINLPRLRQLILIVPPMINQQKFAAMVEKVESLRTKQRESEKELDNLFSSLMQRAFRGELVG
jgi:type I restriction enzyme, S subunit